jgi:hypothetical protein
MLKVQSVGQIGLNKDLSQHELPVNAVLTALGKTETEIDNMFIEANLL